MTPNVADTRNPLIVVLRNGCIASASGGFDPDGRSEKYKVSLLDEEPALPDAAKMLESLPRTQWPRLSFFHQSMQVFLEHVLGIMPFDKQLRPNGARCGATWPDGAICWADLSWLCFNFTA